MKSFKIQVIIIFFVIVVFILLLLCLFGRKHIVAAKPQKCSEHVLSLNTQSITNPYIGWAPDAHNFDVKQPYTLVYANVSWSSLEPEKGIYDFKSFEDDIHYVYWKQKNMRLILRLYLDYPQQKKHIDIPKWLYEETNHDGIFYSNDYGKGFSPNYSNKTIMKYHGELIRQFASHYDNDPEIAFVEIGSIGHWGEWHTGEDGYTNIPFPSQEVSDEYVNQYVSAFHHVKLLARRPMNIAKTKKLGLFNDSFGDVLQTQDYFITWFHQGYVDQMTNVVQPSMSEFWQESPSGGEIANYPGIQYFDDTHISTTLKQLEESHTSWLGPSAPIYAGMNVQNSSNLDAVRNKMGYKYYVSSLTCIDEIQAGAKLPFTIKIQNIGIAPMYYKWKFTVSLRDTKNEVAVCQCNADITKWLPNTENTVLGYIELPENLPKGKYDICYYITDPLTGKPGINFANNNRLSDGSYKATDINIT